MPIRIDRVPSSESTSFATIQTDEGTSPAATGPTDILTFTSSDGTVVITGNSGTDEIDFQVNPDFNNAAGSNKEIQINTANEFDSDPNFIFDKDTNALSIQTTLNTHALHVNGATGATIADVTVGSVSQIAETIDASPTGTVTLIEEFATPGGMSSTQNPMGSGYSASNQTIDYQIYPVLFDGTNYYRSQYFGSTSFSDTSGDSSPFSVTLSFPSAATEQTHWLIEKQIDGGGFVDYVLHSVGTNYEDEAFTGGNPTTTWPTFYSYSSITPVSGSGGTSATWDTGYTGIYAGGTTYTIEARAYAQIGPLKYVDSSTDTGSFSDPNDTTFGALSIVISSGTADGYIVRISGDGGSSWSYHDIGLATSYLYDGVSNNPSDSDAENTWSRLFSGFTGVQYGFKPYGRTVAPSGAVVYNSVATTYYGTITSANTNYIFKHTFTSMPAGGAKILADYNASVTHGRITGTTIYDAGYSTWADGTTITPNHFGFTGTAQVRSYKIYGYSGSLLIYSGTALELTTTDTGGYKYISGSFTYPSGVTTVKITRGINGAAHNVSKTYNSPTTTFLDDATDTTWSGNTTVAPNASVPTTVRFDHQRTAIGQVTDNLALVDTTGSGTRYPSLVFGSASSTTGDITITARIAAEVSTGYLVLGTSRLQGYTNSLMSTQSFQIGSDNQFNMQKSNSVHTTVWGGNASTPMIYAYAAGDSSRGTVYFGDDIVSYGGSSKVVISPSAGGTIGLHFRRTSGATGENILIDDNGSFRGGWNSNGRMFLNAASRSDTTWLLIGAATSGSQIRLASGAGGGTTEGDIWNDSTQKNIVFYTDGVKQYNSTGLFSQTATGTAANTASETNISSTGTGTLVLPANFFVAGKTITLTASGFFSSILAPTLRIKVKFGSTVILDTTAKTVGNHTNAGWRLDAEITCRTTGGSGTVFGQGLFQEIGGVINSHALVNTAATTIATTSSQTITVTAQWGTASASNTISMTNLIVKAEI